MPYSVYPLGPLETNSYLVYKDGQAVVIDAGGDPAPILHDLRAKGLTLAKQIKSGICHVNGPTVHDEAQMPFGGVGASGYGRFGGRQGIDSFTETRWITVETQAGHFPI